MLVHRMQQSSFYFLMRVSASSSSLALTHVTLIIQVCSVDFRIWGPSGRSTLNLEEEGCKLDLSHAAFGIRRCSTGSENGGAVQGCGPISAMVQPCHCLELIVKEWDKPGGRGPFQGKGHTGVQCDSPTRCLFFRRYGSGVWMMELKGGSNHGAPVMEELSLGISSKGMQWTTFTSILLLDYAHRT